MSDENAVILKLATDMEYYARELLDAEPFMKKVHFADHLQTAWFQLKDEIEHFIKTGEVKLAREKNITNERPSSKQLRIVKGDDLHESHPKPDLGLRFRNVTMADGAALLLAEHKQLHGKKIEELLKAGGYRSKSQFFQNVLDSTFKRDGRFRNLGRNTWELNEPSLFLNGAVEREHEGPDEAPISHQE